MRSGGNMYVRGTGTTGLSEREAFARVVADVSNHNAVANGCDGIRTTPSAHYVRRRLIRIPCDSRFAARVRSQQKQRARRDSNHGRSRSLLPVDHLPLPDSNPLRSGFEHSLRSWYETRARRDSNPRPSDLFPNRRKPTRIEVRCSVQTELRALTRTSYRNSKSNWVFARPISHVATHP